MNPNNEASHPLTDDTAVESDATAEARMNALCHCVSLNRDELKDALLAQLGSPELAALVAQRCPYLFSSMPVFIAPAHRRSM